MKFVPRTLTKPHVLLYLLWRKFSVAVWKICWSATLAKLKIVRNRLSEVLAGSRNRKGAFTHNCGKLPYWTLIKLLLKNVKKTISASLDEFFNELRLMSGTPISGTIRYSQQAFSKARSGISHSIFKECFERVLDFLCCPDSLDFHTRFMGVWGRQIIAIASVAFDVTKCNSSGRSAHLLC